MEEFEVIIVGSGPAGATLARLLAGSRRVLLLDSRELDRPWRPGMPGKCCGGLLAPDAQKALAAFHLALPERVVGGPQLFAVRSVDLATGCERSYQRFYVNIDREAFDRWLVELIPATVERHFRSRFLSFADGVVRYRREGTECSARCRYLIAADGAASTVRRSRQRRWLLDQRRDNYIAIQEELEPEEMMPYYGAFFDPELTDFYGWSIPKRDGVLFGAALNPGLEAVRRFELLKRRLMDYGIKFGRPLRREGAFLVRPRCRGSFWPGEEAIFAIGEAAGWISPSSAEGFSYAFESARILAEVFRRCRAPQVADYRRACWRLHWNLRGKMCKIPFLYQPAWRAAIMKSGFGAI